MVSSKIGDGLLNTLHVGSLGIHRGFFNRKTVNMDTYCVYMHVSPSNKKYIGITKQKPEYRWNGGRGYNSNKYFASAINKYGWDNIEHHILFDGLSKEDACQKERELISRFETNDPDKGYNLTTGGESYEFTAEVIERLKKPKNISEEQRAIMREKGKELYCKYLKGRKRSPESIQRMAEKKRGVKQSPDVVKKRTDALKEHYKRTGGLSEEHKRKLSNTLKGRTYSTVTIERMKAAHATDKNPRSRAVYQIKDGEIVNQFASTREAMRATGIEYTSIVRVCNGTRLKRAGGYEWAYVE